MKMHKRNKIILISLLVFFIALTPFLVRAKDRVVLGSSESHDGDFTQAGESVEIAGTVKGDAMVAGSEIAVPGTIDGDLLAAGGTIDVGGRVNDSARLAGGQLALNGTVIGNVTAFGGTYTEGTTASIKGNTYVMGGTVTIRGNHLKSVQASGGRVIIEGVVEGSVTISAGEIQIRRTAKITGDLTYYSSQEANIEDGATVSGKINVNLVSRKGVTPFPLRATSLIFALWSIGAGIAFAYVFWRLFRIRAERLATDFNQNFWQKVGWGFVALIVIPIMSALLMVTLIGIPLGVAELLLYFIALYCGWIIGSVLFGLWLLQLFRAKIPLTSFPWIAFLTGSVFLLIVAPIPVLGPLLSSFVFLWGFGALIRSFRHQ